MSPLDLKKHNSYSASVKILTLLIPALSPMAIAQTSSFSLQGGDDANIVCNGDRLDVTRQDTNKVHLNCLVTETPPPIKPPEQPPEDEPPTDQPPNDSGHFLSSFDGEPANPKPWSQAADFENWDVSVHRRSTELTMQGINAHHGPNCEPPFENTHYNDSYEGAVFQCKNHIMTAINDSAYGVIYLTPNRIMDISNDQEAVIRFDVSTLKTSKRDWIDIWLTPYDQNLQLPLDFGVDLQGAPQNAIHIVMSDRGSFIPSVTRNGVTTKYKYNAPGVNWWTGYDSFLTPDAKRRTTFEVRVSKTHLKFCLPTHDFCWVDMEINQPLDWNDAIVQFGHHSYTPEKDNSGTANTWHWDNFEIENSRPFKITKVDRRYVDSANNQANPGSPALANSHLRFAAIGQNIQVSFDGGANWQAAQSNPQGNDQYHFSSYWTPIPEGATSVLFRGENWTSNREWQARDITVWSRP